jgi:hypothetical protein
MSSDTPSFLSRASRNGGILVASLILVQAITGILMSMYYVPSDAPARTVDGKPLTITSSLRIDTVGRFVDTINTAGRIALVPARAGEPTPSQAAASVNVSIENAPLGGFVRSLHQHTATMLVVVSLIWAALLGFSGVYASNARLWLTSIGIAVLALALAWTGRVLPDDVYSMISRTIVSNELQQAPLGGFITKVLGLFRGELSLSRTYIMHALVMGGGIVALGWRVFSVTVPRASHRLALTFIPVISSGLIAVGSALHTYPVRDAIRGLSGGEQVYAWWTIMPIHAWAVWLGAELAGIVGLAVLVKLLTMPLWHDKMSPLYAKTLIAGVSLAMVLAYMFGN